MTAYKLENITISYDDKIIIKDFNLEIKHKEMVAITGPSGRGKSSLLYILGFLNDPKEGVVSLDNISYGANTKDARKLLKNRIGFLFQNFALIDNESIFQNLSIISSDEIKMQEILLKLNINHPLKTIVGTLSGGEQQRIALAKILMKDPDIILADEPTGSLDHDTELMILDILKELNNQGKTIIIVTHSDVVCRNCTREIKL